MSRTAIFSVEYKETWVDGVEVGHGCVIGTREPGADEQTARREFWNTLKDVHPLVKAIEIVKVQRTGAAAPSSE